MKIKKGKGLADPSPVKTSNTSLLAALGYSQRLKFAVFPLHSIINGKCTCNKVCTSPGKHPKTYDGLKSATTDLETIKRMDWKSANIGIATGKISGFFVVDIDGETGKESIKQLKDHFKEWPETVEQITGSGGSHILFKHHEGIRNRAELLPGVDIRGDGGYIVASPSNHISGNKYEWELSSHPLETPVAEAPMWLLNMLIQPKNRPFQKKPSSYWTSILQGVNKGQRNNAAASLAGYLFKRYLDPIVVVELMHLWNERNNPPLETQELNTIINSIAGKELQRRRGG